MITIDPQTYIINIPQSYLTFDSGTLYRLDTDQLRKDLKAWEASTQGRWLTKTHDHVTEITVAGTTFARFVVILAPYSIEFQDGQYSVILEGSNNNIFDVQNGILQQNQVQIISNNSAGLVVSNNSNNQSSTWEDNEKKQIRDALGIDGDKHIATGGQLQKKSEYPYNLTIDTKDIIEYTEIGALTQTINNNSFNTTINESSFTFTQSTTAITWNISHNLGKYPNVVVIDDEGDVTVGEINYVDINELTLTFSEATSGTAYLN